MGSVSAPYDWYLQTHTKRKQPQNTLKAVRTFFCDCGIIPVVIQGVFCGLSATQSPTELSIRYVYSNAILTFPFSDYN